ncbi:helix-turn-helix domain-containing protein [Kutzneria albida]|nr:helix-turn-helix transcriptional regulator [Kutzneria albida]
MFVFKLGEILRQGRETAKLTQDQAAARMRISNETTSHYERGRVKPDLTRLLIMGGRYKINLWEILISATEETYRELNRDAPFAGYPREVQAT